MNKQHSIVNLQRDWIWAYSRQHDYPDVTERKGKWTIHVPTTKLDEVWQKIASAIRSEKLGDKAKVAPCADKNSEHVICIYTYDSDDKKDLLRILAYLREQEINFNAMYKEDRETEVGNYAGVSFLWDERRQKTDRSPIKWYARYGKIELLTPKKYTPFDPAWLKEEE